ncbi:hypothetical protein LCGC14_0987020 [marine sediment metagenome]|uniref:Calcineurin-like phosphoesterase domain-containing protein n=1 Tax=marine sediment metagenome TaxID=412755 RepID=A0A0F9QQD5_9ZZZZ
MGKKKRNFTRVVIGGDKHCGHRVGLTPPPWQSAILGRKYYNIQRELWKEFTGIIDYLKPIDVLMMNGDAIDGRGERSGGTELIVTNRQKQVDMAAHCINYCKAGKVVLTRGTPYHTGKTEEWEDMLADQVNADKIGDHEFYNINGVIFDVKHNIGTSTIPHGKFTAIARDRLWNLIWSEYKMQPKADILIRSHVHYYLHLGEVDWDGYITPALQGMGSKFGAKICSGIVHFGLIWFDIYDKPRKITGKRWEMDKYIIGIKSQRATVTKL